MLKGKITKPARQFVESYFGRGTASGPITTNPKRVAAKLSQGQTNIIDLHSITEELKLLARGIHLNRGKLDKKNLLYISKARKNRMLKSSPYYKKHPLDVLTLNTRDSFILSHELFHRALRNYLLRTTKKEPALILTEIIASTASLNYLKKISKNEYTKYLDEFNEKNIRPDENFIPFQSNSQLGENIALTLHKKLPSSKVEEALLELIVDRKIETKKEALAWLTKKIN